MRAAAGSVNASCHPASERLSSPAVQVIVNDEPRDLGDGATVADLVGSLGLGTRRVAVEVNRTVVPRAEHGAWRLTPGDRVEIIHFVGGG